jgi:hypothetical protein
MRLQEREQYVVAVIVEGLHILGYLCQRVNQRRADLAGGDVVGDLLVSHPRWPGGCWLMLECKRTRGRLSTRRPRRRDGSHGPSQQDLYDFRRLYVAHNWEEAWQAVQDFEQEIGRCRNTP